MRKFAPFEISRYTVIYAPKKCCVIDAGVSVLHYRLSFLQCDWRRDISLQKVINVNEARADPLSRRWGLGTRLVDMRHECVS